MSERNQRELLHNDFDRHDHNASWPYDMNYSTMAREGEFLPPWLQEEQQFRPQIPERSEKEKQEHLPTTVPSDLQLKAQVLEYLAYASPVGSDRLEVRVKNAEVSFSGTVTDHWMKLQIEGLAEQIPGVKKVNNNIQVDPRFEVH